MDREQFRNHIRSNIPFVDERTADQLWNSGIISIEALHKATYEDLKSLGIIDFHQSCLTDTVVPGF